MKPTLENLKQELKEKNVSLSHQRLKILEYLVENRIHPTVEQIFSDLQKDMPTLSKTTVYNTLRLLAKSGLVKVITIEEKEARFDIDTRDHGHFKCESCGRIYDFPIDIDPLIPEELDKCQIISKDVYFNGFCARCLASEKEGG
jgi:Fe2+ or Zn2+ uptake regulation protein